MIADPARRASVVVPGLLLVALTTALAGASGPVASFDIPGPIETTEGHAGLSWSLDRADATGISFRVEESDDGTFADPLVRYEGPDRATFVSGLREGVTAYRVRAIDADGTPGPWSTGLEVRTTYPGATRVTILMIVGAVVFLATVGAVVVGHVRLGRGAA